MKFSLLTPRGKKWFYFLKIIKKICYLVFSELCGQFGIEKKTKKNKKIKIIKKIFKKKFCVKVKAFLINKT